MIGAPCKTINAYSRHCDLHYFSDQHIVNNIRETIAAYGQHANGFGKLYGIRCESSSPVWGWRNVLYNWYKVWQVLSTIEPGWHFALTFSPEGWRFIGIVAYFHTFLLILPTNGDNLSNASKFFKQHERVSARQIKISYRARVYRNCNEMSLTWQAQTILLDHGKLE